LHAPHVQGYVLDQSELTSPTGEHPASEHAHVLWQLDCSDRHRQVFQRQWLISFSAILLSGNMNVNLSELKKKVFFRFMMAPIFMGIYIRFLRSPGK
jgi:hypothetical protein